MTDAMHQRDVWESIALSFDRTRARPWDHVIAFARALPPGIRVLDLMAGNGRHVPCLTAPAPLATPAPQAPQATLRQVVALDWSQNLLRRAQRHLDRPATPFDPVQADAGHLPFPDATFDAAICVAGVASVPNADHRRRVMEEARRVLRPGSPMQWTVWWRQAPRFADVPGPTHQPADITLAWQGGPMRTYHLYTQTELRSCLQEAGFHDVDVQPVAVSATKPDNLVAVGRR